jgi:hypothetical protein
VKSANGSEYYCDGLRKSTNPDYATTPFLQHGVVAIDGKLVPFAYPKSQKICWNGLPHIENGTIRLNTNPIYRLDNENLQENFYHTLTPFSTHSQYEECQSHNYSRNPVLFEGSNCQMHHRLINYSSDTLPLKTCSNNNNHESSSQINGVPFTHLHYHHATCQRQHKIKRIITPAINEGL